MTEREARLLPKGRITIPTCRQCGQDIPPRSRYCLWCGQRPGRRPGAWHAAVAAMLVAIVVLPFVPYFVARARSQATQERRTTWLVPGEQPAMHAFSRPAHPPAPDADPPAQSGAFNIGAILPCGHLSGGYSNATAPPIVWCRYGHRFYWMQNGYIPAR